MERIELRYSGSENGAGLVASSLFAIAGLGFIAFLVMKAGTDPKALWLGPQVKNPLLANLILGGIAGLSAWRRRRCPFTLLGVCLIGPSSLSLMMMRSQTMLEKLLRGPT